MQSERGELKRAANAAWWGVIATVAMTVFMAIGAVIPGLPGPAATFPAQIIRRAFGGAGATVLLVAAIAHLAYGAAAAEIFVYLARPVTIAKGVGYAAFLWLVMQVLWIPWLGWGDFGLFHSRWLALYSLLLHLPYGAVLGWMGAREHVDRYYRAIDPVRPRA